MSRELDVYFAEIKAGVLAQNDSGALTFTYDIDYLAGHNRAISVSMPLQEEPWPDAVTHPFFSGLLPDEAARQKLAGALGISSGNVFGMLEVIGGECAGALSFYFHGEKPEPAGENGIEMLTRARLQEILEKLRERPLLGGEEGIRLSLAGAQDKLAVCVEENEIGLAKGGRPTTHILKPFIPSFDGTVENELFCLRLAARMGFNTPAVQMGSAGNISFLLVERYDRQRHADRIISRLHQEDFCQALSVPPELKYEEEGGPGTDPCLDLVGQSTQQPAADRLTFIRTLVFHYLVGNADAHAKNYALLYTAPTPDLAPLYDVLCTAAYPGLAKRMAMTIGGRGIPDTIQLDHWLTLVPATRAAHRLLVKNMRDLASTIGDQADALLAELSDEGITHQIFKVIRRVIDTRSTHLLRITDGA
jgi:serine/threonine-protein kinase HipA